MKKADEICIIEDNNSIRKLFCTLLQKSGHKTVDFAEGQEALDWLNDNMPKALIIDIMLPDLNGADIKSAVRNFPDGENVPIIAVTGFAKSSDREKYIDMGFDAYIPKPINTSKFAKEINEVIEIKNKN